MAARILRSFSAVDVVTAMIKNIQLVAISVIAQSLGLIDEISENPSGDIVNKYPVSQDKSCFFEPSSATATNKKVAMLAVKVRMSIRLTVVFDPAKMCIVR